MLFPKLKVLIEEAVQSLFKSEKLEMTLPSFELSSPPPKVGGDLASNIPLILARTVGRSPRVLAEQLIKNFPSNSIVSHIDIAGAGFLNFTISDQGYQEELAHFFMEAKKNSPVRSEKILIEFVSANPTGPLHIGHGRGAALGDSLVRIFRYLGYQVESEFYINDSGGQVRNLGYSMEARVRECKGEAVEFPEKGYKGTYVIDFAKEAIQSGRVFQPIRSDQMTFDENDLAGFASAKNLEQIKQDLADFRVHFDHWFPESQLHKQSAVPQLFEKLTRLQLAYEKEGALWFKSTDYNDDKDRVLQKTNEAPTYFSSDIAYHENKFSRGYDRCINIWGADHHSYAIRLKAALVALGHPAEKLDIILNQLVSIKGGRLSKRSGDMITLREVMDEVGTDATRFFFALRSPGAHFEFDLDLAKKQASDNPVFYVQYVHARCCSIFEEAKKRNVKTDFLQWKESPAPVPLQDVEKAVLLHLSDFENVVELCAKDKSNHHLTVYLQGLAGKYHSFYEKCYVLDENPQVRSFRLDLVEAIRRHVAEGLSLLGVSAPEKL